MRFPRLTKRRPAMVVAPALPPLDRSDAVIQFGMHAVGQIIAGVEVLDGTTVRLILASGDAIIIGEDGSLDLHAAPLSREAA